MPPRFDHDQLTLHLSVADLLERELGRRIGFSQRSGYERMWLGQAIHSRYQERRMREDPSYQREVTLTLELDHAGYAVSLRGRLDGLCRDPDGVLRVEEIKSVRAGNPLPPALADLYQRQARIYAWMTSELRGEPVRAELVLIAIGAEDDAIELLPLEVDAVALAATVRRRLEVLVKEDQGRHEAVARRRLLAANIEFPYHQPRAGQREIVDAVQLALEQREHCLVEATTGLGKTVACLFPVMRFALEHDKRVFVLTAKTLQQTMANQVLDLLNRDRAFQSLQLRAKAKMCANDEVICHEDYCRFAKDYFPKLARSQLVPRLLERHPSLLPDEVFAAARDSEVCPFEVSLELGTQVQAVVCDYNYAFDPYVQLHDFGPDNDLSDTVLVVDEIHNLIDRGRGYYSPRLEAQTAHQTAQALGALPTSGALVGSLRQLCSRLADLIEATVFDALPQPSANAIVEAEIPEEALWELRPELDRAFIDYLEHRRETKSFRAEDPFAGLYFGFLRFLNTLQLANKTTDGSFSACLELEGGQASFRLLCKDASRYLGDLINRTHSTIGLSATLTPTEFYRDLLGFAADRTTSLSVHNPFPAANRRVVIDSTVRTTYRLRDRYYLPIAERLGEFAAAVPGNCLALFPSYQFLTEIAQRLPADLGRRVLVQRRADSESQRQEILDTLRSALFGDVLVLAVAGGVFAEGVDYPGDMLRAVAVVGPCLPALSLEQKLLEAYYQERFERGFEYAFVIPGMTRVVQAAGRLIRSPKDRGVIALFDHRFVSALYQRHMPADWRTDGEGQAEIGHPASVAAAFFRDPALGGGAPRIGGGPAPTTRGDQP